MKWISLNLKPYAKRGSYSEDTLAGTVADAGQSLSVRLIRPLHREVGQTISLAFLPAAIVVHSAVELRRRGRRCRSLLDFRLSCLNASGVGDGGEGTVESCSIGTAKEGVQVGWELHIPSRRQNKC